MTRRDGRLSLLSNLDCDFTFVFGETDLVASFDSAFGGRERICIEFADFLKSTSVDLGEGDIYAFMRTYLPKIADAMNAIEVHPTSSTMMAGVPAS
ncbi:hypothetical protein ACEP9W_14430 [Ensifer aridi]